MRPDPRSISTVAAGPPALLSAMPARPRERRRALGALVVSVGVFLALAPFAKVQLPALPAFLPA